MPTTLIAFASLAVVDLIAAALDPGQTIQWLVIAVGLAAAMAVGRSKQKDAALKDYKIALEGASARGDAEHDARREAEQLAATLQGKVDALEHYAAPEAFKSINHTLGELRATVGGSISAQGELILKNTELVSKAVVALERVAKDLERLADRIHPEKLEQLVTDFARLAEALGASGERPPGAA